MKQIDYEITGYTQPARDGSDRQQALEEMFRTDLEGGSSHEVRFEELGEQGRGALAVFLDNVEAGVIEAGKAEEVSRLIKSASSYTATVGVNGHDLEEYEKIIDRYRDKKFWKQEDPDFDDKKVNKDYEELMQSLKEGSTYQAYLHFFVEGAPGDEDISIEEVESISQEDREAQKKREAFVRYFKILKVLSVILVVFGIVYLKISYIMGGLNIFFGLLGFYFSVKYTKKPKKKGQRRRGIL